MKTPDEYKFICNLFNKTSFVHILIYVRCIYIEMLLLTRFKLHNLSNCGGDNDVMFSSRINHLHLSSHVCQWRCFYMNVFNIDM